MKKLILWEAIMIGVTLGAFFISLKLFSVDPVVAATVAGIVACIVLVVGTAVVAGGVADAALVALAALVAFVAVGGAVGAASSAAGDVVDAADAFVLGAVAGAIVAFIKINIRNIKMSFKLTVFSLGAEALIIFSTIIFGI